MLVHAFKYALVGIVNTAITLAIIFALIYWCSAPPLVANAIGYLIGFANSFVLSRTWIFRSQAPVSRSVARFVTSAMIAYGLNAAIIHFGMVYAGASKYWIQLAGAVVYTTSLFLLSRAWAFADDDPRKAVQ